MKFCTEFEQISCRFLHVQPERPVSRAIKIYDLCNWRGLSNTAINIRLSDSQSLTLTGSYVHLLHPGVNHRRLLGLCPILALCVLLSTGPSPRRLHRGPRLRVSAEGALMSGSVVHMTPGLSLRQGGGAAAERLRVAAGAGVDPWMLKVCVLRWTVVVGALLRYIVILGIFLARRKFGIHILRVHHIRTHGH